MEGAPKPPRYCPALAAAPAPVRNRLLGTLLIGSGLVRTGFIAAVTVTALVAEDLLGSVTLSGMPAAAVTIGVAAGTAPIAALMAVVDLPSSGTVPVTITDLHLFSRIRCMSRVRSCI